MTTYPNMSSYQSPPSLWGWLTGQGDPVVATSRLTVVLSILVIFSAGVLGFTALRDLFISINLFHPWLGYLFPILFDAAEIVMAISVLNAQLQGENSWFAWAMVVAFTCFGIGANVAHAIFAQISGLITHEQMILAVIFTSLFPLSIALVTHNLKSSIKRDIKRSGLVITLAQLEQSVYQGQVKLQQTTAQHLQLEQHRAELIEQVEAERATLAAQIEILQQEIAALKRERRQVKTGTGHPEAETTLETEQKAYAYLAEQVRQGKRNREINGAELGREIGTSESFGRRLKKRLLAQVRADLGISESTASDNGAN